MAGRNYVWYSENEPQEVHMTSVYQMLKHAHP